MLLVLTTGGASSRVRQNILLSDSKTPAAASSSPKRPSPRTAFDSSGSPPQAVTDEEQTRGWKTYRFPSSSLTFRYPQNLVLTRQGRLLKLQHSIRFKHIDPCDYSDNTRTLYRLVDFDVSFEIGKNNKKNERADEIKETPSATPDAAEQSDNRDYGRITAGSLKGEFETHISEGCGEYYYSFPLPHGQILTVRREIIGIFSPGAQKLGDEEIALKKPGIINRQQEERLFKTILSTFKLAAAK
jgi:hypothetical protein